MAWLFMRLETPLVAVIVLGTITTQKGPDMNPLSMARRYRHVLDLDSVVAGQDGRGTLRQVDPLVNLWDVIESRLLLQTVLTRSGWVESPAA